MSVLVHHTERCPDNPKLQAFVAWWQTGGPFAIKILHGNRTDAEQAKLYAQGRWLPGKVVTNARTLSDSAHGRSGAIDAHPVRELYANGNVKLVYLGDEEDEAVRAEALRRLNIYADIVIEHGLESGRNFPGLQDLPHAQVPEWRTLPLNP